MIRLLANNANDHCLMERIGRTQDSFTALRIRALWRAYVDFIGAGGPGTEIPAFYANETGKIALCKEGNFAALFLENESLRTNAEAFLPLIAGEILSEYPLDLPGFQAGSGGIYAMETCSGEMLPGVTEALQPAYELLSQVFPDGINPQTYSQWYADLSHRVRHGMSRVFTLDGRCTGTLYFIENGQLAVTQLATHPDFRGQGLARRMLQHIAASAHVDGQPFERILLMSQSPASDHFYEHIGFHRTGNYFIYERQN